MLQIRIEIARPKHAYDILLEPGLATDWQREVDDRVLSDRYLALVDAELGRLRGLPAHGTTAGRWHYLWVEPGIAVKTLEQFASLCEQALRFHPDRETVVVGYGGGSTLDLAGFLAANLMYGLRLVQVPTSLVAQIDNSVGGRNQLTVAGASNVLGTFWQPELVLIDPIELDSLPEREYLSGVTEMVKTAVVDGPEFFHQLQRGLDFLVSRNHGFLAGLIARCCRIKMALVAEDEYSRGKRRLLRFGHNFGAMLEALAGYDGRVRHGEAVSVGMVLAGTLAMERGYFSHKEHEELRELLAGLGQPTAISQLGRDCAAQPDWPALLADSRAKHELLLANDHAGERLGLVLPYGIGDCRFEHGFQAEDLLRFLRSHAG